jgi:hypothetical protein
MNHQYDERSQLFIRSHNEPLSVAAMRVCNPDCSPPLESIAETQPQLQPAFLRLSAMISYDFTQSDSAIFVLHATMTKMIAGVITVGLAAA